MGHDPKEAKRTHSLALAATLAVLGASVGVDVPALLAVEPTDQLRSDQVKIGHEGVKGTIQPSGRDSIQQKLDQTQQKLPSLQQKTPVMPGVKPVDPPR